MAEITAAMVMKLRDKTQLPMMDCKKALQESGGDSISEAAAARESARRSWRCGRIAARTKAG